MDVSQFPTFTSRIADALQAQAAKAAADAMAIEFHAALVDVTLRTSTHRRSTVTPSKPGQPPALVTGTLRRSARIVPATSAGSRAVGAVTVSAVYARIQELGGDIEAKRAPFLRFQYPSGKWHTVKKVHLPARPYMKPTRDLLLATGRLQARAAQAIAAVTREAAGG